MRGLIAALGLKELGLLIGGVILISSISVPLASASVNLAAGFQDIVAIAQAIENGQAIPQANWNGGIVPYAWGGGHGPTPGPCGDGYSGPSPCLASQTKGLDCSGFVRWVYSIAFGSDVLGSGGTTNQIVLPKLQPVNATAAVPGDLAFFGTLSDPHHVGIYIGNGQMIDALETGTNVRTDPIFSDLAGYYHYQGAPYQLTSYQGASFSVVGPPTISAAFIDQVLAAHNSPAQGNGELFYAYGVQYGIDTAFALAFFEHESTFGTAGIARNTLSIGNSVCTSSTSANMGYFSNGHCYQMYSSWAEGIAAWYSLIRNNYVDQQHLFTVAQIIPVYAPSSDGNDVGAYITAIQQSITAWRSGNPNA